MAFLPDPMPGLPIPQYFAKGLRVLTGRTRIPASSVSNIKASPGWTPSARRTASGTVICPFDVILACFSTLPPYWFPYFTTSILTYEFAKTGRSRARAAGFNPRAPCGREPSGLDAFGFGAIMSGDLREGCRKDRFCVVICEH